MIESLQWNLCVLTPVGILLYGGAKLWRWCERRIVG